MRLRKSLKVPLVDPPVIETNKPVKVSKPGSMYDGRTGVITNSVLRGTTIFYTVDFGIASTTFRESEVQSI